MLRIRKSNCGTRLISSHSERFCKKVVLKNFSKLTGKHLRRSLFFVKAVGGRLLLKRKELHILLLPNVIICPEKRLQPKEAYAIEIPG